jgi:hypothetical protein
MSDVDIHANNRDRRSKIQIEEQQPVRHADFRDAQRQSVVYPNRSSILKPARSASLFEIIAGIVAGIAGIIFVVRLFFVSDINRTLADRIGLIIFYVLITVMAVALCIIFISRALKYTQERKIFMLPNGYPVSIKTILSDYGDNLDMVFSQPGYFNVEQTRAANPIVAPGEINTTYSPSNTYAPSNMPKEKNDMGDDLLARMLDTELPESTPAEPLPELINFFDHIDERIPGYVIAGMTEGGELLQVPIMKMFNHLVGGNVGSGKSIYLRSLVYQLIAEADESEIPLELGLADIENNTFPEFRGCRHVRWYAGNYVEIEHMTAELLREVERRKLAYETLTSTPKDIERYNILAGRENAPELPIIVVLYDEFSALMHRSQAQQKRILSDVLQLALRARKYGIFLIIAGQTFKADLIDSAVLGQFSFNVAFRVRTGQISQSILGQVGAEKLTQPGEALVKIKDGTITHVQGLHLDDDELLEALEAYRDPESKRNIPELVRVIIDYAHTHMDDQVKFRELELYMREQGISRAEFMDHIGWMDEHKFTLRGAKNTRMLNWHIINGDA